MLNVALTGNIAAGKSTVVELLRRWGATIIDADELAREAEAPGTEVLTAIVKRFGTNVLHRDGTLDRPALRAKVMGDDAALADLNAIVHPAVRRRRDELLAAARARNGTMCSSSTTFRCCSRRSIRPNSTRSCWLTLQCRYGGRACGRYAGCRTRRRTA